MTQLHFTSVSFTYPGLVDPLLDDLTFAAPPGWTGVVGPNGSGKSTLLALAVGRLAPDAGTVTAPGGRVVCEQRTDHLPEALADLLSFPDADAGRLVSVLGLERSPALIVMDEPTNHLDLVSMRCLEEALADFAGALLIVSHDDRFVAALARTVWTIRDGYVEVAEAPVG